MKKIVKHLINISVVTLPLLILPSIYAQGNHAANGYSSYDEGYDDGYADAMDDCPCPPPITAMMGRFYLGGELGYDSFRTHDKIAIFDEPIASIRSSANSGLVNLYAGYGEYFPNNFYLGGEVFLGRSCADGNDSINVFGGWDHINFKSGTSYGLGVLPGYKLPSGPLMYARVGYARSEFKINETLNGFFDNHSSVKEWSNGFVYGLGIQSDIYKNFSLRFEYRHIDYSSFNNPNTGSTFSPSDNQASLGLSYSFDKIPFRF